MCRTTIGRPSVAGLRRRAMVAPLALDGPISATTFMQPERNQLIFPNIPRISTQFEQAFSKLKAHLRKAAERTIPRLSRRIGALVTAFSPQECTNYFRHAGYASR